MRCTFSCASDVFPWWIERNTSSVLSILSSPIDSSWHPLWRHSCLHLTTLHLLDSQTADNSVCSHSLYICHSAGSNRIGALWGSNGRVRRNIGGVKRVKKHASIWIHPRTCVEKVIFMLTNRNIKDTWTPLCRKGDNSNIHKSTWKHNNFFLLKIRIKKLKTSK